MAIPNFSNQTTALWKYDVIVDNPPSASYNNPLGTYIIRAESLTVASGTTPNFRSYAKRRWALPFHNYSKRADRWTDTPFTLSQRYVVGTNASRYSYSNTTVQALSGAPFGYFSSVASDDPTQKVIAKLQDQISTGNADLAVSLAEAHKTAAMVAKTATRIAGALKALRRVDIAGFSNALGITISKKQRSVFYRRARLLEVGPVPFKWHKHPVTGRKYRFYPKPILQESKLQDFMSQTWLEYTYGWKPLLQDVYNTAKASASIGIEMSGQVRYVRASSKGTVSYAKRYTQNQFEYLVNCKRDISVQMGITYKIEGGGPSFTHAFGLDNPLTVAWELVPFSFVADWFLPVGTAIRSLTAYNGLVFAGGWKTTRHAWTCTVNVYGSKPWATGGGTWFVESCGGNFNQTIFIINRVGLSDFPSYGFPTFKNPLSVSHMTSAIALLQTFFKK